MPLNDQGYFIPGGTVTIYRAPVDTVAPASTNVALDAPGSPWDIIGHVGDETNDGAPSFTRDGGDASTKGSATKRSLRTLVEPVVTGIDVDLTQWTRGTLALYHGTTGGAVAGVFSVTSATDGLATETALLIVWGDGSNRVGLYAPRVAWTGRDSIDTDSIQDAVRIPLHASFLDSTTLADRYEWLSPTLLALS